MASPYIITNQDFGYLNSAGQDFALYIAFLNPVAITTIWSDLNLDNQGNWALPPNVDTAASRIAPYTPLANIGPNRIGFVNEPLYFDATLSNVRNDLPISQGFWSYTGTPTATLYGNSMQIGLTWSSPGLYTIYFTAYDQANNFAQAMRQVMIYQDRTSTLPGVISVSGLSGSLDSGGWQCQLTTVNSQLSLQPPDAIPVGTYQPVVLMAETRYEVSPGTWLNATIGPHGQFNPGAPYRDPRILFDGYIQAGSMHQDVDKDTLSFTCSGPQMILQETKAHLLGYYNATAATYGNGQPTALNPSSAGTGFQVAGLQTSDVIRSLVQYHSNIAIYHDMHIWETNIPTGPYDPALGPNGWYNLTYTTLSVNEGTIWQNISDLCSNEWTQAYFGPDGGLRVGPQVNYRGGDYWNIPTALGGSIIANSLVNFAIDLGYTPATTLAGIPSSLPLVWPALPMSLQVVHPWGPQLPPPQFSVPFQTTVDPSVLAAQELLIGPPILCTFSDSPVYDSALDPPSGLFPWISANWPQDIALYPVSFDITENYTGKAALTKLVGTLFGMTTLWTSWYPQDTFSVAGDGISTLVTTVLPAGDWVIDESHVLPDVTAATTRVLLANWWWEIARRDYYARNICYGGTITLGLFTAAQLGDIVGVTRQKNTLGPHWSNKLFYVSEIDYNIDLTSHTWQTTLTLIEVTSVLMSPIQPPPAVVPNV